MTTHVIDHGTEGIRERSPVRSGDALHPASAAFALSAAIAIVFNTLLTWGKEAYPALNAFMKSLSGHHWITHGVVDVALFALLGLLFLKLGTARQVTGTQLVISLVAAVFVGGLGLAAWFVFV